jgi:hypothetical protein
MIYNAVDYPRNLVIVPVPKRGWAPSSIINSFYTNLPCQNCAFYLSSGNSNPGQNFPNIYFPFSRVAEKSDEHSAGWITKFSGGGGKAVKDLINDLKKLNSDSFGNLSEADEKTLFCFLDKFGVWWQLQSSAALIPRETGYWDVLPILRAVKTICLKYDYIMDMNSGLFKFKRNKEIIQFIDINSSQLSGEKDDPKDINKWLYDNKALCENRDL